MATTQLWSFAKFFQKQRRCRGFRLLLYRQRLRQHPLSFRFRVPVFDFGNISADDGERIFSISPTAVEVRKWLAPAPTGSSRILWPSEAAFCTGTVHAVDARSVQRSDVDVQTAADGGDILDILRFIGHDRACAACQQNIGDIVYRNVICDVVYERVVFLTLSRQSA